VANADHKASLAIAKKSSATLFTVSTKKNVAQGAQLKDGKIMLKHKGLNVPVMKTKEVGLIGPHNLENILAAVAVGALHDVESNTMKEVIRDFKGLPHRLEFIKVVKGADYYNDSFSVNPESSIAGIRSFKKPLHLIAGGYERFADFKEWAKVCMAQKNLKTIVFTGKQSAERMFQELRALPPRKDLKIVRLLNLREAIIATKTYAQKGDIVLLSPGCPSFEEFKNYKERGETFKALIQ
jgi:UDP-N-acetylmuramoylalanine--D-glutamate ligase